MTASSASKAPTTSTYYIDTTPNVLPHCRYYYYYQWHCHWQQQRRYPTSNIYLSSEIVIQLTNNPSFNYNITNETPNVLTIEISLDGFDYDDGDGVGG